MTSERKIDGEYACAERRDPSNKIVFVGAYNYFSGTKASPYAMTRADYVFYEPDETDSTDVFTEFL